MEYPQWFWDQVKEMEEDLADGHMSFTDFNRAMDELERELEDVERLERHSSRSW